jgi:hypothetical protein
MADFISDTRRALQNFAAGNATQSDIEQIHHVRRNAWQYKDQAMRYPRLAGDIEGLLEGVDSAVEEIDWSLRGGDASTL